MELKWKDIEGYEGLYQVSNMGDIKSLSRKTLIRVSKNNIEVIMTHPEKILKKNLSKDGYIKAVLCKNGKTKHFRAHRIVGKHFIDNPDNKPWINHKNGIKTDNRVENLEWSNASENTQHAYDNGLITLPTGQNHHFYKRKPTLNNKYTPLLDTQTGVFYDTLKEAADAKGMSKAMMFRRLNGIVEQKTSIIYA